MVIKEKQDIDLNEYENRWSEEEIQNHSKRGKFIRFTFLDLKKFGDNENHEELNNIAIRQDGNRDNADKNIAYSYKIKGWSYNPFPPIVDTSFNLKDGRTRIRAAIRAGFTLIPVAVFEYPDEKDTQTAYVQRLTEGLIGNDDLISRPTKYGDLFEAGIAAVTNGGVDHNKTAIADLLFTEFEALRFVKQDDVTNLVESIFGAVLGGQRAVWNPNRDDVLAYLKNSPDLPPDACLGGDTHVKGKKVFVYSSGDTNRGRLWMNIAKRIPEECYAVLYSGEKNPSQIKSGYEDFMAFIEMRYRECFEIVNRTASSNGLDMNLKPPIKRPWKVIGVIPQMNDETHETLRRAHRLSQIEEY
jgi:hypothetical protein